MKIMLIIFLCCALLACNKADFNNKDLYDQLCGKWSRVDSETSPTVELTKSGYYQISLDVERGKRRRVKTTYTDTPLLINGHYWNRFYLVSSNDEYALNIFYNDSKDTMLLYTKGLVTDFEYSGEAVKYIKK